MRKMLLIVFVVVAICVSSVAVFATEGYPLDNTAESIGTGNSKFTAISTCMNGLTLNSGGRLTCVGETSTRSGYRAGITIDLQKNTNGSWNTIKSWSKTSTTDYAYLSNDWYVVSGTYRLQLTHTAYTSSGSLVELVIKHSKIVTY